MPKLLKRDILMKLHEAGIHNNYYLVKGRSPYDFIVAYAAPEPRICNPGGWHISRPGYKLDPNAHFAHPHSKWFPSYEEEEAWAFIEKRGLKREDFVKSPFARGGARIYVHRLAVRATYESVGLPDPFPDLTTRCYEGRE